MGVRSVAVGHHGTGVRAIGEDHQHGGGRYAGRDEPLGLVMLMAGIGLVVLGAFRLSHVVKVEV